MPSQLTALIADLVAIDSVNPSLVAGGAGETEMAAHVSAWARDAGLDVEVLEATRGRPSVVVRARGSGGGRSLMLCGHLDTVSVAGMEAPHTPRIEGDRLYGRGAYDMKAGLAAALLATRDAAALGLAGDVVVAAVADEEHESLGVQEVLGSIVADAAIVTEPTELRVAVAHKGFVWSEVRVTGAAAHGSRPQLGVDAIVKAGPVLTALGALDAELARREHPLVGRPSVHASVISGGVEFSSYAAGCVVGLERRTLPGESGPEIERELAALLERCRRLDPELRVEQRELLVRQPFEIARDAEVVDLVCAAAAHVGGQGPDVGGVSYWADSAFIAAAGIPTVLFGPGGEGAHAVEEWVSLADTEVVARALTEAATRFCA